LLEVVVLAFAVVGVVVQVDTLPIPLYWLLGLLIP
jgi:hypothetical protein